MNIPRSLVLMAALGGCAAPNQAVPGAIGAASDARNAAALRVAEATLATGGCREAKPAIAGAPVPMNDPGFPGALRQPVLVEGCGGRGLLNVMVLPLPQGGARLSPLFPGTTRADATLQGDGLRYARVALQAVVPGCERVTVNDTRFRGAASGEATGGSTIQAWSEHWVLGACGQAYVVPIRFIPNASGTAIAVSSGEIKRLN